jgi:hypothetical protein
MLQAATGDGSELNMIQAVGEKAEFRRQPVPKKRPGSLHVPATSERRYVGMFLSCGSRKRQERQYQKSGGFGNGPGLHDLPGY